VVAGERSATECLRGLGGSCFAASGAGGVWRGKGACAASSDDVRGQMRRWGRSLELALRSNLPTPWGDRKLRGAFMSDHTQPSSHVDAPYPPTGLTGLEVP
jgi:hypothetical protein